MKTTSFKNRCERAESHTVINTAAKLYAALPDLIELKRSMASLMMTYRRAREIAEDLEAMCSEYALAHPNCFDNGLNVTKDDLRTGDVTIDGTTYHFAAGYRGFERLSGENKTAQFIAGLPVEWVRTRQEIDATAVYRCGATDEDLAKYDLAWSEHNVWSEGGEKDVA